MDEMRQVTSGDRDDLALVLDLVRDAFAYMDDRINPPSSVHRLTIDELASPPGEVWVIDSPPVACMVATPRTDVLYLGNMAVRSVLRGEGYSRRLVEKADRRAREIGLTWLELEARIELVENHRTFEALGFEEVGRTAHPGFSSPTSVTFRRRVASP